MSTPSNDRRTGPALGNGITVDFPFDYYLDTELNQGVYLKDANGAVVKQVHGTNFSLLAGSLKDNSGGTARMTIAPATGEEIVQEGEETVDQDVDYQGSAVFPAQYQGAVDALGRAIQQINRQLAKCFKLHKFTPTGDITGIVELPLLVAADIGKVLRFKAVSPPELEVVALATTVLSVSSFMESVLDDATAAAARTTLGVQQTVRFNDLAGGRAAIVSETGGNDVAFTAVDITAFTGADVATHAIISLETMIQTASATNRDVTVQFRQTGTTPATRQQILNSVIGNAAGANTSRSVGEVTIPLNSLEQFDYRIDFTNGPSDGTVIMDLVGYIHIG